VTRVIVYVEGPSDKAAMEALLEPLLGTLRFRGVAVDFFETISGDRKKSLVLKIPEKAVNILYHQPGTIVVALPDLYPKNRGFEHETPEELAAGMSNVFRAAVQRKRLGDGPSLEERFKVFCFKHDLEALILASEDALRAHLRAPGLKRSWKLPVEDVDHGHPPKRVVEEIFREHGQKYRDTVDAPLILGASSYASLAEACPQCFRPFIDFLASL
jgi:hypothetical protein